MTKLKNTKKGMAKKALSISLVAAMLATSNVPVWAAEDLFTDGSAAVEAPVVEEPAAEVEAFSAESAEETTDVATLSDAITEDDIDVSGIKLKVDNKDVTGKTATFLDTIVVDGKITKTTANGVETLQDYNYGWRVAGTNQAIYTGVVTGGNTAAMNVPLQEYTEVSPATMASQVNWAKYVGKTLELYIFRNDGTTAQIANTVIAKVSIAPYDLSSWTLMVDNSVTPEYNGHAYTYGETSNILTGTSLVAGSGVNTIAITGLSEDGTNQAAGWDANGVKKYFNVSASQTATNAGEKLTITASPKSGSPYTGTISASVEVQKRSWTEGDIVAELSEPLTVQYTGNAISIPSDKITLKEKANTFANVTFPNDVITDVYTTSTATGPSDVHVKADGSKIKNWALADDSNFTTSNINKVKIDKRDLSSASTSITVKNGKIPVDLQAGYVSGRLVFEGKESGTPDLNLEKGTDYTITIKDSRGEVVHDNDILTSGTYTAEIVAPSNSTNTTGAQTIQFVVGNNVVQSVSYATQASYKPDYTGTAITPTKDDLGDLTIVESVAGGTTKEVKIDKDFYQIVSYDKNTNAATYDANGKVLTQSDVVVKILNGAGSYVGETFTLHFEIQPLAVSEASVTVPSSISYNNSYTTANEYKVPLIVTARNAEGDIVKGLAESDYTVEYKYENTADGNKIGNHIIPTVTITNTNFMGEKGAVKTINFTTKKTEIVAKALTDSMIQVNPSTYTYTGAAITPEFVVMDGSMVLYDEAENPGKGEYKVTDISENLKVGTGKITIEGIDPYYSGTATATFEITPANTQDVKVEIENQKYTGRQVRPRMDAVTVTLNGNDVTSQFEIVSYGENVNAGTGTVVLKPIDGNKNFTGSNITAEFNIVNEIVEGTLFVYDANGKNVTTQYEADEDGTTAPINSFTFDGTAKTFASESLSNLVVENTTTASKAEADDFEIKYADNISGKKSNLKSGNDTFNIAYVYAVAKDGTGYAGGKTITLSDGTQIKNVVAYIPFAIKNVHFVDQNVTVQNATYAGGLPVKPEVLVQINGNTLVEGKDYELQLDGGTDDNYYTNTTNSKIFEVTVVGKGGYEGSKSNVRDWGIDKKDIADCDVAVTNGVVTVMNGYIPVPVTEYTSKNNGDGTYTITANTDSKNYTGSKTVTAEGQAEDEKPDAPMIQEVRVSGNNATVVLSGETEGATGYDYVISTDRDCINNKDYDKVNKNILGTETTFTYTQQGVYYAYCHAWKRVDGVKVFSDWSEAYPFVVSAITPEQPVITSVKKSGRNLTVTWTQSENATTGYDVVMGTAMRKVNGEMRPVEYGKAVKKVGPNTFSVTFKSIPKGTYYVGLHAHNRTSESGVKVFSPWSNAKKVTF